VLDTFREAAVERGLLEDDKEWDLALTEAALAQTGRQMRHLFAMLLLHCQPGAPELLFERHITELCEDILQTLICSLFFIRLPILLKKVIKSET
jgi:hypothetical protein